MRRSPTVLALTRNTGGFFHGELLTGLIREVSAAGGRVVVVQTRDPADDGTRMFPAPPLSPVAWGHADGVVVESLAVERRYLEAARPRGRPSSWPATTWRASTPPVRCQTTGAGCGPPSNT